MNFNISGDIQSPTAEVARRLIAEGLSWHYVTQIANDLKAVGRADIVTRLLEQAELSIMDSYDISLTMPQEVVNLFMYEHPSLDNRRGIYLRRLATIKAWRDRVGEYRLSVAAIKAVMMN